MALNKGIFFIILCTLLNASAQFLLKLGIAAFSMSSLLNIDLILGLALYGLSAVMLILGLRHGELASLYPVNSLTYVWVALISFYLLHETITLMQTSGIGMILAGVFFLSKGGKR